MGTRFALQVGEIPCKRYLTTNGTHKWWTPKAPDLYWAREKKEKCSFIKHVGLYECIGTEATPFLDIPQISKRWEGIGRKNPNFWEAPEGLFLDMRGNRLCRITRELLRELHYRGNKTFLFSVATGCWSRTGHSPV